MIQGWGERIQGGERVWQSGTTLDEADWRRSVWKVMERWVKVVVASDLTPTVMAAVRLGHMMCSWTVLLH